METFRVVAPAPGLPALLEGGSTALELIVAGGGGSRESLERFADGLALRDPRTGQRVGLRRELGTAPEPLAAGALPETACGFASLAFARGLLLARLRLRAAEPLVPRPPRTARVFDLVAGERVLRARCVGALAEARPGRLALAFASDLHVAAIWERVAEALERSAPAAAARLLRPERCLARFVAEANALAARGELDLVVLGGDLVDHVRQTPGGRVPADPLDTNLGRLLEGLADLELPALAIPGNHDHRLAPWRPRVHGLGSAGLPRAEARRALRVAGLWDRAPLRRADWDALRSRGTHGVPAIRPHLEALAPATDFALPLRGIALVFASTGRDVLPRLRSLEPSRLPRLLRSVPFSRHEPDSEGLFDAQVEAIERRLAGAKQGAALFLHAPLLNPRTRSAASLDWARIRPEEPRRGARAAEERLQATGLRRGTLFRNPVRLLEALGAAPGPAALFSGHVHHASALRLERGRACVRPASFPAGAGEEGAVPLLTAPALGQVGHTGGGAPGYLLARFESGRLERVEHRTLPRPPDDASR